MTEWSEFESLKGQEFSLLHVVQTTEWSEFESQEGKEFSLLHVVQTGSRAHPASYTMGTGNSSPGDKAAGA
jgi:hypothetical protein